jgi:hypothetical protein
MAQDDQLMHNLGRDLANSRAWPNWSTDSEFRTVRDRSAGERGETTAPAPAAKPSKGERG